MHKEQKNLSQKQSPVNVKIIELDTLSQSIQDTKHQRQLPNLTRRSLLTAIVVGTLGGSFVELPKSKPEPKVSEKTILLLTKGITIQKGDTLEKLLVKDLPPGEIQEPEQLQTVLKRLHEEINGDKFYENNSYRLLNQYSLYTLTDAHEHKNDNNPSLFYPELNEEMDKLRKAKTQKERRTASINILLLLERISTLPAPKPSLSY